MSEKSWEVFPADPTFPFMSRNSQYLTKYGLEINASVYGRARSPLTKPDGGYSDIFIFFFLLASWEPRRNFRSEHTYL